MARSTMSLVAGFVFGIGLGLARVTRPGVVLGHLDFMGAWDPRLLIMFAGSVAAFATLFPLISRRRRPISAPAFERPKRRRVDGRLLAGAVIFGVGWGLAGLCPGPALTTFAAGAAEPIVFVATMFLGFAIHDRGPALVHRLAKGSHLGALTPPAHRHAAPPPWQRHG